MWSAFNVRKPQFVLPWGEFINDGALFDMASLCSAV